MSGELIVHKNRTNRITLGLKYNASGESFTAQIRKEANQTSDLLGTWEVEFATDGVDGELILTLPQTEVDAVAVNYGYMDLKRTVGSVHLPVFAEPLQVKFQEVVTV